MKLFLLTPVVAPFLLHSPALAAQNAAEPKTVKIVCYNVLGSREHLEKRLPSLSKILEKSDADIIALQEVTNLSVFLLEKQPWFKKYNVAKKNGQIVYSGGLLILSKSKIIAHHTATLKSLQNRKLQSIDTLIDGEVFTISNCHLDSPVKSKKFRINQLKQYAQYHQNKKNVVFVGDFNFGPKDPEQQWIPKSFIDSWKQLHPKKLGYTWNKEVNPLAKKNSFSKEPSRRIDRILMKSQKHQFNSIKIIGNTPIEGTKSVFTSDHFGLSATISLKKE